MGNSLTPLKTANSRVFLIEGRARPDHQPSYQSCLRMMGVSQGYGDIERIENPDPNQYGKFIEVGQIRGATERATTSLEGRYAIDLRSTLMRLARGGCAVDVQLHLGECQDPSDFNTFSKILILEQAQLTTYNTDDLGALQSGDNAAVNENADLSAKDMYEVVPISFGVQAGSIVTNEVLDVVICDSPSCGDCEVESDGCKKIYAITKGAGGSPSTPPDLVFSEDGGVNWYAVDIDSLLTAEDPDGLACLGTYLIVVSEDSLSLHYVDRAAFDTDTPPDFEEVATGFVVGAGPRAISSYGDTAWIAGGNGYIYKTTDPTAGVTVVDAGTLAVSVMNDIHAYSEDVIVAVGNDGAIVYTENGETFALAGNPVGVGVHLYCVFVKSKTEWWVGTSTGRLYYTLDGGTTWTQKAFAGSGVGRVDDIQFSTDSVGFIAHATAAPRARILRTYDGGFSWKVTPERTGATLPLADRVNALAVCPENPNFVVGVGLADNGTDGIIIVGSA
jgi:hypothetical protein